MKNRRSRYCSFGFMFPNELSIIFGKCGNKIISKTCEYILFRYYRSTFNSPSIPADKLSKLMNAPQLKLNEIEVRVLGSLIEKDITSKVQTVTDFDVNAWYDQNKARVQGAPLEQVRQPIRQYLTQERMQAVEQMIRVAGKRERTFSINSRPFM